MYKCLPQRYLSGVPDMRVALWMMYRGLNPTGLTHDEAVVGSATFNHKGCSSDVMLPVDVLDASGGIPLLHGLSESAATLQDIQDMQPNVLSLWRVPQILLCGLWNGFLSRGVSSHDKR